jgi:hypothetical protein
MISLSHAHLIWPDSPFKFIIDIMKNIKNLSKNIINDPNIQYWCIARTTESKTGKVKTNKSILATKNCYKNYQEKDKLHKSFTSKADI